MSIREYLEKMIKHYDDILIYYYTTEEKKNYISDYSLGDIFNKLMNERNNAFNSIQTKADIFVCVCLLDRLYSTRLQQNPKRNKNDKKKHTIDVYAMTNRIFERRKDLNKLIEAGNIRAVEIIRGKNSDKYYDAYSFATKFCSFCNEDAFPMFDEFVKKMLKGCIGSNGFNDKCFDDIGTIKKGDLEKDYAKFKKVHEAFQKYLCKKTDSKHLSCKYIDKFLWLCGKHYGTDDEEFFYKEKKEDFLLFI